MSLIVGSSVSGGGPSGFQAQRSLRFNLSDSAYLNRTLGSSNRRTFTFSAWVKRSSITSGDNQTLLGCINTSGGVNQQFGIQLLSNDTLMVFHFNSVDGTYFPIPTTAVFRDPSAWYHIVVAIDTTQATSTNRGKIYVNGVEQTLNSPSYFTQNLDLFVNSGLSTGIGAQVGTGTSNLRYLGGYMTEVYFIDGQALTPSSFGETDTQTGVWEPKAYSGTYGTNGFYLKFADNSGTTSTTLGKDSSGNGNNWTPNNFSVTAGAGNDSLVDSPTAYGTDTGVGGEVRGNYATYNSAGSAPSVTLSNGNLDASHGAFSSTTGAASTFGVSSGKWYWEVTINTISSGAPFIGIVRSDQLYPFTTLFANNSQGYAYRSNGQKRNNSTDTAYGASYTNGDVIGVALDMDAGTIVFYKNNSSQGTAFSSLSGTFIPIDGNGTSGGTYTSTANFGQRAFAYTAPSGFKALCTQNLPTPTIGATSTTQANDYFNIALYTGNNSTKVQTGLGFKPDFLWFKSRSGAFQHALFDVIRGSTKGLEITTQIELTSGPTEDLVSFDNDGFTMGPVYNFNSVNGNALSQVAWAWKANGTGVTNTAGNITSTVSANTTSGFSVVTYTGNGSANQTVGHGLGVAPAFGMLKDRDTNSNNSQWQVFHTGAGDKYAYLSTTAAFAGTAEFYPTSGSSTTVTIARTGGVIATTNESGDRFVMYLFAPVAGYSSFGSYTGNNSDDGPFIFTNFRPAFVLIKATNTTQWWTLLDSKRDTYNVSTLGISPNSSDSETTFNTNRGPHNIDFTSNGFKIRTSSSGINGTNTFIYAAFAEFPFKFSLAR